MKSSRWALLLDTVCSQCLRFIETEQSYRCGHQLCSACATQICPVCTESAQRMYLCSTADDWITQECKYHRFTILLFADDVNEKNSLMSELSAGPIRQLRELGGELFGVLPTLNNDYEWVRTYIDKHSRVYRRYIEGISPRPNSPRASGRPERVSSRPGSPMSPRPSNSFHSPRHSPMSPRSPPSFSSSPLSPRFNLASYMEHRRGSTGSDTTQDSLLKRLAAATSVRFEGVTAVVLTSDGKIVLKWDNDMRGKYGDPTIQFLTEFARYYFLREETAASMTHYITEHSVTIFERILKTPELRLMFESHLSREHNLETLQFIEQVEVMQSVLAFSKNNGVEIDYSHISEGLIEIYTQYVSELNLSNPIRQQLQNTFGPDGKDITKHTELMEQMITSQRCTVFEAAVEEVLLSLQNDSFVRYFNSKEFKFIEELIPFFVYNVIYF